MGGYFKWGLSFFRTLSYIKPVKLLALTGTPGTGKSTVGEILKGKGYRVVDLNALIKEMNLAEGWDEERMSLIVDTDRLKERLEGFLQEGTIVEGHLSHHLSPMVCVVLRTSPKVLFGRLVKRGYGERKARENAEAEALGLITAEALQMGLEVYEVDTTSLPPPGAAEVVERIYRIRLLGEGEAVELEPLRGGRIDYLEEVLEWY